MNACPHPDTRLRDIYAVKGYAGVYGALCGDCRRVVFFDRDGRHADSPDRLMLPRDVAGMDGQT